MFLLQNFPGGVQKSAASRNLPAKVKQGTATNLKTDRPTALVPAGGRVYKIVKREPMQPAKRSRGRWNCIDYSDAKTPMVGIASSTSDQRVANLNDSNNLYGLQHSDSMSSVGTQNYNVQHSSSSSSINWDGANRQYFNNVNKMKRQSIEDRYVGFYCIIEFK